MYSHFLFPLRNVKGILIFDFIILFYIEYLNYNTNCIIGLNFRLMHLPEIDTILKWFKNDGKHYYTNTTREGITFAI